MKEETALLQREKAILEEIIHYYMTRQEAISARTLSKISRLSLSPTTIRNLMEDLSDEGFLTTEGVTRGRIPTQKAFAIYVTHLETEKQPSEPPPPEIKPFEEGAEAQLPMAIREMGHYLADQSGLVALIRLPSRDQYPLNWVQFSSLQENQVLVTIQTLFGDLWNKLLVSPDPFPKDLLEEVNRFICHTYRGKNLESIRNDIMAGEPKDLLDKMPSLGAAFRMLRKAFEWPEEPQKNYWGEENLFALPEVLSSEHLEHLHHIIKDPLVLERALAHGRAIDQGVISIGTETGYPGMEHFALVGHAFGWSNWTGKIAILGPMRMDYTAVFHLSSQVAHSLNRFLAHAVRDFGFA